MRCARVSHAGAAGGTAVRRSGSCLPVLPNGGDASLHFPIPWGDRLGIQTIGTNLCESRRTVRNRTCRRHAARLRASKCETSHVMAAR